MNRALLEKPFDPEQIRRRQGRNGMLDYVEGHSVIQRLNDALDGAWSFEITHHEVREDEVIVLGKLTAESIARMAFGASQVTRERESSRARLLAALAPPPAGGRGPGRQRVSRTGPRFSAARDPPEGP